ncbi:MAG: acyl-CoA dehydrogenase family protein, partial [Acidimicrobiia bacterium]
AELGLLDLATDDSPDPENAQLNTSVAIEMFGYSGQRVPIAETIWARWRGLAATDGFVAIASSATNGSERLVPYASAASALLSSSGGEVSARPIPTGSRAAYIDVDDGHLWCVTDDASFVDLDPGYVWRTAAAATVGYMARSTDMAAEHARTRVQFGKPIGSFQALQFRLSECQWRLLGLRLLVREASWRADRSDPRADVVSALAWLYAREVGRIVTRHTHQIFGAIGFTRELGLTRLTGAAATSRALLPARAAAERVRSERGWEGTDPPSTVLGGFARA